MELSKFIYLFGKEILKTAVSETISIENWDNKDFDNRYIEYDQAYLKMKDKYLDMDEETVLAIFAESKSKLLKNYYDIMQKQLRESIRIERPLGDDEFQTIIEELLPLKDSTQFNKDFIKKLREIEETFLP